MSKARVLASGYVSILTCNQRVPRVPVDQNDYKLLSPALEFFCPRKQHEFDEVCKILQEIELREPRSGLWPSLDLSQPD